MGIAEQLLLNLTGLVFTLLAVAAAVGRYAVAERLRVLPVRLAAWRLRGYPLLAGRKRHRASGPAWIVRTPATGRAES